MFLRDGVSGIVSSGGFDLSRGQRCGSISDGVRRPEVDDPPVFLVDLKGPDDVRRDGEDDLILLSLFGLLGEEVLEDGDLLQQGPAGQRLGFSVLKNAADEVDLAIGKPCLMLDAALPNGWLGYAVNGLLASDRGDLKGHFEGDIVALVYVGSDIDIDADVDVLELGADAGGEAALEGASGDGDAVADLE